MKCKKCDFHFAETSEFWTDKATNADICTKRKIYFKLWNALFILLKKTYRICSVGRLTTITYEKLRDE